MKKIAIYFTSLLCGVLLFSSCDDFLTTYPRDVLSPATGWQTQDDVRRFLVGLYAGNQFLWGEMPMGMENASDIGFGFHSGEGWRQIGDGSQTAQHAGRYWYFYCFVQIRRVNYFLANIGRVEMDEAVRRDMIAQARFIRAWRFHLMNWLYGDVPLMLGLPQNTDDAQVPRTPSAEVQAFINSEIDLALQDINDVPEHRGMIGRGAVLMLKMRAALWQHDYARALSASRELSAMGRYRLHTETGPASGPMAVPGALSHLFSLAAQDTSPEIILSRQRHVPGNNEWFVTIPNNADGGWSSFVPTQNLVDMFEMANGLTICNPASGYDPTRPFYGRDPRLEMTVVVPGVYWRVGSGVHYRDILNTLDRVLPNGTPNVNFPGTANNTSSTGLSWARYMLPFAQYTGGTADGGVALNPTNTQFIFFRYAESLLIRAEAFNEVYGPGEEAFAALDAVRARSNMPPVDRVRYGTQATLREMIRRERAVELAGNGTRRFDILRWRDANGQMLALTVMPGNLYRMVGYLDYDEPNPMRRAVITGRELIELRRFQPHNRFFPIPQHLVDNNPNLTQNPGF